jgi:hypothetical protein
MLGSILSAGASLIGGLAGGKKSGTGTQLTPFQSLPSEVQDTYLNTFLPDVQANYAKEFNPFPMKRVANPMDDPFGNTAAYEWQQYSDQMGGLFSPFGLQEEKKPEATNPDEIPASIKDVLNTILMSQLKQSGANDWMGRVRNVNDSPQDDYNRELNAIIQTHSNFGAADDVMKALDLPKLMAAKPSEYSSNLEKASKTASEAMRKYLLSVR